MIQETPTFMGFMEKLGAWGFSPSAHALRNCDRVWDISRWKWETVEHFMSEVADDKKIIYLQEWNTPEITESIMKDEK